jgi:hypothetical protein
LVGGGEFVPQRLVQKLDDAFVALHSGLLISRLRVPEGKALGKLKNGGNLRKISLRMLRSCTLGGDDLSCEWEALTAARLPADGAIGAGWAASAVPRRLADVALPNRVTDTNDHADWHKR